MSNRRPYERLFDFVLFALVPLIVYAMMAIYWLLDPFHAREKLTRRQLPDLERFPSATSRKLALLLGRGGSFFLQALIILLQIGVIVAAYQLWNTKLAKIDLSASRGLAAAMLTALMTWWTVWWLDTVRILLLAKPTRLALRRRLVGIGLPTCIPCGRNMKGLVDRPCPDCGAVSAT